MCTIKLTHGGLQAVVVRRIVHVDIPAARRHCEKGAILGVLHVRYPRLGAADLSKKHKNKNKKKDEREDFLQIAAGAVFGWSCQANRDFICSPIPGVCATRVSSF